MIMHLSAPHGQSINDGISKEEFTLRYSRIDDAIRLINFAGGKGALLAKVDPQKCISDNSSTTGGSRITRDTLERQVLRRPLSSVRTEIGTISF